MFKRLVLVFALFFGVPVTAQADLSLQQALSGLNGMLTAPADPILGLVQGDDAFDAPVGDALVDRLTGLLSGVSLGCKRLTLGTLDVPLALTPLGPWSPKARFVVVPGLTPSVARPPGF